MNFKRIIYIIRNTNFDEIEYITSDMEDAKNCVELFSEDYISPMFTPYIEERKLDDDEEYDHKTIFKTVEWKREIHNLFPSEFKERIIILITLHKMRESIISWLPRDILYYLFYFLEGVILKIDTTGN